eukprot:917843-Prorocentrum_minimum.AAC.1
MEGVGVRNIPHASQSEASSCGMFPTRAYRRRHRAECSPREPIRGVIVRNVPHASLSEASSRGIFPGLGRLCGSVGRLTRSIRTVSNIWRKD